MRPAGSDLLLIAVRWVLPSVLVLVAFGLLIAGPPSLRVEGFALFAGAGLSIVLLSVLHRAGVDGNADRDREEDARRHLDEHGRWPDEPGP